MSLELATVTPLTAAQRIGAVDLADIDAESPRPVFAGLAYAGQFTILAAREGMGKSTLARQAAGDLAAGWHFLDARHVEPGRTLWLGGEESAGQWAAALADAGYGPLPAGTMTYAPIERVETPRDLADAVTDLGASLVVVDPLADLMLRDAPERDYAAVRRAVGEWQAALGEAAGLALHHTHRERDISRRDSVGEFYGSVGLSSTVGLLVELRPAGPRADDTRRDLVVCKSRIADLPRGSVTRLAWDAPDLDGYSVRPADVADDLAAAVRRLRAEQPNITKKAAAVALRIPRGGNRQYRAMLAVWE